MIRAVQNDLTVSLHPFRQVLACACQAFDAFGLSHPSGIPLA